MLAVGGAGKNPNEWDGQEWSTGLPGRSMKCPTRLPPAELFDGAVIHEVLAKLFLCDPVDEIHMQLP